ncbi:MAG: AraC family transcriptional regulator [Sphingomonadales bacterium]|nr:MAG: AraC family transcriptional regulator [Sphingomonadales bacterium]TNF05947.1 MAG: AraC family transcriptional regulator [Sphingomonadales bacterium]
MEIWKGQRPLLQRATIWRREAELGRLAIVAAHESLMSPTDWYIEREHHTVIVHLDGRLDRMEVEFSKGPSGSILPVKGDVWIVPAGCRYAALAQGEKAHYLEISVPASLLSGVALAPHTRLRDDFLHAAAVRLDALLRRPEDSIAAMTARAMADAMAMHLRQAYGRETVQPVFGGSLGAEARRAVTEAVRDRLDERHTLESLAAVTGMSVRRFTTAFREAFGITPWQFVLDARMEEGARLLRSTEEPVTAIALAVGFATPSHFATAFTRKFGVPPSRYRQSWS